MPATFSRSIRSLKADQTGQLMAALLLAATLLLAGLSWFFLVKIKVYRVSPEARLEVEQEVHPVAAPVAGNVVAVHAVLGQKVQPGDVLFELNAEKEKLQLQEENCRVQAFQRRILGLQNEIQAENLAWPEQQKAAQAAIEEAEALHAQGLTGSEVAHQEAAQLRQLSDDQIIAQVELMRGEAEASQKQAAAHALELAVTKLQAQAQALEKVHRARLAKLESELAMVEGDFSTAQATVRRCQYEINKRLIVAPVAGTLAEVGSLRAGAYVAEGDQLGAVIPPGELKAIAQFTPLDALGRIQIGQKARLRLDGFPWMQYGAVAATVTSVASESRQGRIRVEFSVQPESTPMIPLQHGLPGTVEVTVESVSPATLVLRAVGHALGAPNSTIPPENANNALSRPRSLKVI